MIGILRYYCVVFFSATTLLVHSFSNAPPISNYQMRNRRMANGGHYCSSPHPSYCASSTYLQSTEQEEDIESVTSTITINRPVIHWTVSIQKIGWRDEETGKWFDEDGPREGPPQNYWRQRLDQRAYEGDMDLVTAALNCGKTDINDIESELDEMIKEVEGKNSVRRPSRHRNLLGKWAPVFLSGKLVATSDPVTTSNDQQKPKEYDLSTVQVPFTIEIFRTAGRKLQPKNHYGVFDASLAEGEEVTVRTSDGSIDTTMSASETNEPTILDKTVNAGEDFEIQLGGVTYVSDYLVLQRNSEGTLSDLWLRVDVAYLGKNEL